MVCRQWCYALHLKHIRCYRLPPAAQFPRFKRFKVESATFNCSSVTRAQMQTLCAECAQLGPHLQKLDLGFAGCEFGNEIAETVGRTSWIQLTSLSINLSSTNLSEMGAQLLATLGQLPQLRSLSLKLSSNHIGPQGAASLASLQECSALRSLSLDLAANTVGSEGVRALAHLPPGITSLSLNLLYNMVGNDAVEVLCAALARHSHLTSLVLNLANNGLTAPSALSLSQLRFAPALLSLSIDLSLNMLRDEGASALSALKQSSLLTELSLALGSAEIHCSGAKSLAELFESPTLTSLCVSLDGNRVGNEGVVSLSQFRPGPALRRASLGLYNTGVTDAALERLAPLLAHTQQSFNLVMDLEGNKLTGVGWTLLRMWERSGGVKFSSSWQLPTGCLSP